MAAAACAMSCRVSSSSSPVSIPSSSPPPPPCPPPPCPCRPGASSEITSGASPRAEAASGGAAWPTERPRQDRNCVELPPRWAAYSAPNACVLQSGQSGESWSHFLRHGQWYEWLHGREATQSPQDKSPKQIAHGSGSPFVSSSSPASEADAGTVNWPRATSCISRSLRPRGFGAGSTAAAPPVATGR